MGTQEETFCRPLCKEREVPKHITARKSHRHKQQKQASKQINNGIPSQASMTQSSTEAPVRMEANQEQSDIWRVRALQRLHTMNQQGCMCAVRQRNPPTSDLVKGHRGHISIWILQSGSKAKEKGDARNHWFGQDPCVCMAFLRP